MAASEWRIGGMDGLGYKYRKGDMDGGWCIWIGW